MTSLGIPNKFRSGYKPAEMPQLTPEQADEIRRCTGVHPEVQGQFAGFLYWCANYALIQDKATHRAIPFTLYECQKTVAEKLILGLWLWILKARQLGMTWLVAAWVLWKCTFFRMIDVAAMSQDREYAAEFLRRVKFIRDHLPEWMRPWITGDSEFKLEFNKDGHGGSIRSLAASEKTARSLTADIVFFDEASRVPYLQAARQAAEPALERSGGQMVGLTTSSGPGTDFHGVWFDKHSKFENIFFPWDSHPDRDAEWYKREKKAHLAHPLYMKQEYPETSEEAFESPAGRIYPMFGRKRNCRQIDVQKDWPKYRFVDWGAVHPFVCLWATIVPGDPPGLTYEPSLNWFPRQMIGYRWKEGVSANAAKRRAEEPEKDNDDCCDAVRYGICHFRMNGHVHVFREHVVPDSAMMGKDTPRLAQEVKALSGDEVFVGGVADRSRQDNILTFVLHGVVPLVAYHHPWSETPRGTVSDGIDRVNSMIVGTPFVEFESRETPVQRRKRLLKTGQWKEFPGTRSGLAERMLTEQAKDELYGHGWRKRSEKTQPDPAMKGME